MSQKILIIIKTYSNSLLDENKQKLIHLIILYICFISQL
jgi:hypothetical protein